ARARAARGAIRAPARVLEPRPAAVLAPAWAVSPSGAMQQRAVAMTWAAATPAPGRRGADQWRARWWSRGRGRAPRTRFLRARACRGWTGRHEGPPPEHAVGRVPASPRPIPCADRRR